MVWVFLPLPEEMQLSGPGGTLEKWERIGHPEPKCTAEAINKGLKGQLILAAHVSREAVRWQILILSSSLAPCSGDYMITLFLPVCICILTNRQKHSWGTPGQAFSNYYRPPEQWLPTLQTPQRASVQSSALVILRPVGKARVQNERELGFCGDQEPHTSLETPT